VLKRLFDLTLVVFLGVVLLPVYAVVALLILINDGWPVVFAQERVGRLGRNFTCYKFRTMKRHTGDHASHAISAAAITRFGSIVRRTKMDELPQILNVLRGEMSFVGPRPCLPKQTELVGLRQAAGIYELIPGITGLAQVRDVDMSKPDVLVACEMEYLQDHSFVADLRILVATFFGKGLRTDAAQKRGGQGQ
jgi:O-antigen biosynthesis protein WbqP